MESTELALRIGAKAMGVPIKSCHLVWYNYTLGNWKALVMTESKSMTDVYVEVTYRKSANEYYVDTYTATNSQVVKGSDA